MFLPNSTLTLDCTNFRGLPPFNKPTPPPLGFRHRCLNFVVSQLLVSFSTASIPIRRSSCLSKHICRPADVSSTNHCGHQATRQDHFTSNKRHSTSQHSNRLSPPLAVPPHTTSKTQMRIVEEMKEGKKRGTEEKTKKSNEEVKKEEEERRGEERRGGDSNYVGEDSSSREGCAREVEGGSGGGDRLPSDKCAALHLGHEFSPTPTLESVCTSTDLTTHPPSIP
eukprot:TsM_000376300 transcript=TsM_000376300 gene=TsM_000376300